MTFKRIRSITEILSTGKLPRVPRDVESHGSSRGLTFGDRSFTINTIRGDSDFVVENQPHLNEGLWAVYLAESEMIVNKPPTDGREVAPGAHPKPPPVSE